MKSTGQLLLLVALSLGLGASLNGCGSNKQNEDGEIVGVKGKWQQSVEDDGPAPKYVQPTMDNLRGKPFRFPSEYPLAQYPGSKVIMANVRPVYHAGQPNMVALESPDRIEMIAAYYKQRLPKEGWIFKRKNENKGFSSTIWTKGDEQAEIRVSPTPSERSWVVQLFIGPHTR